MRTRTRSAQLWAAACGLLLIATTSPAQAIDVSLPAASDNCLYSDSPDRANALGPHLYAGLTATGAIRRSLLQFDVSSIPAGSTITAASLELTMNNGVSTSYTFTLERVVEPWGEGTSNAGTPGGLGAAATPGDATWSHSDWPTTMWSTSGGTVAGGVSGSGTVTTFGTHSLTGAGMVADIQAWVDGAQPNHGWLLRGNEIITQSAKRFVSRHGSSDVPMLEITYVAPVPIEHDSWTAIKDRFSGR